MGTNEQKLFQTARSYEPTVQKVGFNYHCPAPNGRYQVRLGFADMWSSAAGQRTCNITIEGQVLASGFDAYASFGAKTAGWKVFEVEVLDGMLDITISKSSSTTFFLSALEAKAAGSSQPPEQRKILMNVPVDYIWNLLTPEDGTVSLPAGGVQTLRYGQDEQGTLRLAPATNN